MRQEISFCAGLRKDKSRQQLWEHAQGDYLGWNCLELVRQSTATKKHNPSSFHKSSQPAISMKYSTVFQKLNKYYLLTYTD